MYNTDMDINTITLCPERTIYKRFINDPAKQEDENFFKKKKALQEQYKLAFHMYLAEMYPHLKYEKTNDKVYWDYNDSDGVYKELSFNEVRSLVIKLLIDEDLMAVATEAFVKTVLNRYRASFSENGITFDGFDKDNDWFHAANGWVNLNTLELVPHTPERLSRFASLVVYDKDAICPLYDKFLNEDARLLPEESRVISQFSGILLTKEIKYEKMLTMIGRSGSGKSTLVNIWNYVLGDLATKRRLNHLSGDSSRFIGSTLLGKQLCWFDEVDIKRSEMSNDLGNLITGTTIDIERKGIDGHVEADNQIKCVLTGNRLPLSSEDGMFRRMILIYFERSFTDEGVADKDMLEKMYKESSGILNKMIQGLHDIRKMGGFTMIPGHEERISEYKEASDPIAGFLGIYFEPAKGEEVSATKLFEAYKAYRANDSFVKNLTIQKFGMMLKAQTLPQFAHIQKKHSKIGNVWSGLRLKRGYDFSEFGNITGALVEEEIDDPTF